MRSKLAILLCLIFPAVAHAGWERLSHAPWSGKTGSVRSFNLADGLVEADVPGTQVHGHWIRVRGIASADAPDFKAWITVFDSKGTPLMPMLTTRCTTRRGHKLCENIAWVKPGAARVRLAFYSNMVPVEIDPLPVEWHVSSQASAANIARYDALHKRIQQDYYRSAEVDWPGVRAAGAAALESPPGIDPIPHAMLDLISRLPESRHMAIHADGPVTADAAPALPSCVRLRGNDWKITIPPTPDGTRFRSRYVSRAHQCLSTPDVDAWLVDLTSNGGGDAPLMFSALAPIFGSGPMMTFKSGSGEHYTLALGNKQALVGGKARHRWAGAPPPFTGTVSFVIDARCASACEALAIAAKGRFALLGQPTAGLATANEAIRLNRHLSLALTSGYMSDIGGKVVKAVEPDRPLNDDEIEQVLAVPATTRLSSQALSN